MSKELIERRLREVTGRLRRLREDLGVADEQLAHFSGEADEARIRALVSETPGSDREHRDAQRHAAAMTRHRDEVRAEIESLERSQDELLDQLQEQG
ncbi:MAG: hypothetical protein OEW42_05015 [Acidimicrobiia bacterium]|nr:hypothetical protein [Acidimicrobiia bacterium]MDH5237578.1 hypothetical protein [Acidimicrobiia bacterium]